MPNPETEVGIILDSDSPVIKVGSGSGKMSRGKLHTGVLVIADKSSGEVTWVGICGNDNLTKGWKPRGKMVSFAGRESYRIACEEMSERLGRIEEGVNELLQRPAPLTREEVKLALFEGFRERESADITPKGGWSSVNTISTILGTAGSALAAGFLFPEKRNWEETKITPGTAVQTGNGTIVYGPNKISVERKEEKNFNAKAAVIGGIIGGTLTYVVNKVLL
jgi:hypothetical protein